jgi:hypothetical protein
VTVGRDAMLSRLHQLCLFFSSKPLLIFGLLLRWEYLKGNVVNCRRWIGGHGRVRSTDWKGGYEWVTRLGELKRLVLVFLTIPWYIYSNEYYMVKIYI